MTSIPDHDSRGALDALRTLPGEERRATLAAWLSDANAVPDAPELRRIDGGQLVAVEDLLDALRSLDEAPAAAAHALPVRRAAAEARRRPRLADVKVLFRRHRRDDDDDDPPPCPAVAGLPPVPQGLGAAA